MTHAGAFAHPKAELSDRSRRPAAVGIGSLPVSESWRLKLRLLRKAGGPGLHNFKALTSAERRKVGFNVPAFLFGPLYYLAKGMWRKALFLSGACIVGIVVLGLALELAGLGRFANALGYGAAAIFAVRANIDYYKKMVLGDNGWW